MKKTAASGARVSPQRKILWTLLIGLGLIIGAVFGFVRFYSDYIDGTLYAERLNQMREVTTQLFSGLEDVVKNQWRSVSALCRSLEKLEPETLDQLIEGMKNQAGLSDFDTIQCNVVAVDSEGRCYTQLGRQGLVAERNYLLEEPDRISYVSNSLIDEQTRMVFLQRLPQPIQLRDGAETVTLTYYGVSQNMEELNPYFECAAYSGSSSVYVVDDTGLKLFSSDNGKTLKGFNVMTTLENMEYLHGTSFADTRQVFEEKSLAYSNAVLGDTEYYYALYRMDSAAWTLIFLVPSDCVAMNTVDLVNMTVWMVLAFAALLILVSILMIFFVMRAQQKSALEAERGNNAKLEKLNKELASASKAKTDFLSNMSHDIRTPMNAIVGITKLMEHDKNDPEKLELYIHKVQSSSQHLLSLINDVLDMSKIESSEVSLNQERICLAEQISQVESIIRPQTEEHGQNFVVKAHEITHGYLIGDAVRLRQVFINLLSNAVKYTPDGGTIHFDLTELPEGDEDHATIAVAVTDTGYGMTKEFAAHIFEPFTRAENSVTNKVQGTGLGMAITKNIVDLMGGTITVDSKPNQGSCFQVTLPMQIDKDADYETEIYGEEIPEVQEDAAVLAGRKFLCAEDNELNAEILNALMDMNGASCTIYPDGEKLVEVFASVRPGDYDAIFMDVQMPVMNGLDAARAIRHGSNPLGQTIPIIAMTANAFSSDVQECLDAGMNAHVAKPLDIGALERTLKAIWNRNASGGGTPVRR